ncbi:hypothetical protein HND25_27940 [Rhodococcus erythropolis]|uniref:TIR domain-containing protein n=1 Tax=Rhodococcus erythropolis TaxID=1833 RepID=UPI000466D0B3|nr:TIR domain-containing protein [Rhodococcus erythropolis]MBO8150151.1 TIR domain-containing protein [Rhodococcus erythropolis]MDO1492401.1 hypothetical protein [Rhodococcus erythropolis]GCB57235.1 hypothetical protein rerp_36430 [Rhodococcus erythropolis]
MADPRAFLSFDYDHNLTAKNLFAGQAHKESPTSFIVEDWSSKSVLPEDEWEELISKKIGQCHLLIVLVGKTMASAYGVAAEIAMAKDKNVPIFGVYVDGADSSSNLPSGLARNRTIDWHWDEIGAAIDQCMTEGKNV